MGWPQVPNGLATIMNHAVSLSSLKIENSLWLASLLSLNCKNQRDIMQKPDPINQF